MTIMTSWGLTLPRLAWLSVRISVIVMTMVTSTTSVAPKLRASSLRNDEWNNIGAAAIREKTRDYGLRTQDLRPGRCMPPEMRCPGGRGDGQRQRRSRPHIATGAGRTQVRGLRGQAGQIAAGLARRRRRRQARDHRRCRRWLGQARANRDAG